MRRTFLLGVLFLTTALAGCGDGPTPLRAYLMGPGEAPDGCAVIDLNSPQGERYRDLGMETNPGAVDPSRFEHDGILPLENLVIAYRCTLDGQTYDLVSAAERFEDAETAAFWAGGRITCTPDDMEWRDGAVVAGIEDMDGRNRGFRDDIGPAVANIEARTDVERICP